jgi:hypothetical protein
MDGLMDGVCFVDLGGQREERMVGEKCIIASLK